MNVYTSDQGNHRYLPWFIRWPAWPLGDVGDSLLVSVTHEPGLCERQLYPLEADPVSPSLQPLPPQTLGIAETRCARLS